MRAFLSCSIVVNLSETARYRFYCVYTLLLPTWNQYKTNCWNARNMELDEIYRRNVNKIIETGSDFESIVACLK